MGWVVCSDGVSRYIPNAPEEREPPYYLMTSRQSVPPVSTIASVNYSNQISNATRAEYVHVQQAYVACVTLLDEQIRLKSAGCCLFSFFRQQPTFADLDGDDQQRLQTAWQMLVKDKSPEDIPATHTLAQLHQWFQSKITRLNRKIAKFNPESHSPIPIPRN